MLTEIVCGIWCWVSLVFFFFFEEVVFVFCEFILNTAGAVILLSLASGLQQVCETYMVFISVKFLLQA